MKDSDQKRQADRLKLEAWVAGICIIIIIVVAMLLIGYSIYQYRFGGIAP